MSRFSKILATSGSKLICLALISSFLVFASCSKSNQPAGETVSATPTPETKKITSAGVVNAKPQPVEVVAGKTGEAIVQLTIQSGYHLNANPPTFPYLKATELEIRPSEGVTTGKLSYPPAVMGKFAFSEQPLAVYEGETQIRAEIKAANAAPKGNQTLNAVLRIQACDEQVCYPPGKIDLQIPVTIK